jgi:hypothetical protein
MKEIIKGVVSSSDGMGSNQPLEDKLCTLIFYPQI